MLAIGHLTLAILSMLQKFLIFVKILRMVPTPEISNATSAIEVNGETSMSPAISRNLFAISTATPVPMDRPFSHSSLPTTTID